MLELTDIRKQYALKPVLDGISLSINTGEIVSMLGPSGSGKTTLLNVILGLVAPEGGTVSYDGEDITRVPMNRRDFNIVFQDYSLFPNLNAWQNITYSVSNKKGCADPGETDELIDFLDLRDHLKKRVHELSGGQKQRVALARTLMTKPRVLLMDEPFSALDGIIKETVKKRVKDISRKFRLTTVIVTHDPEEALTLSDRVLIINEGRVAQFDKPRTIVENPATPFIERFILGQLHVKRKNLNALFGQTHA